MCTEPLGSLSVGRLLCATFSARRQSISSGKPAVLTENFPSRSHRPTPSTRSSMMTRLKMLSSRGSSKVSTALMALSLMVLAIRCERLFRSRIVQRSDSWSTSGTVK